MPGDALSMTSIHFRARSKSRELNIFCRPGCGWTGSRGICFGLVLGHLMGNLITDLAVKGGQSRYEFFGGEFPSWIGTDLYKGG